MRNNRKNKREGFVFVFVVIALAIILAIFFNYSMSARARKEYMVISKASSDLEESASQTLGTGILDAYIADQMISKNSEAVYDYMGYFLVKDILENSGTVKQEDAIKVWEKPASATGKQNSGPWNKISKSNTGGRYVSDMGAYIGGDWSFNTGNLSDNLRVSKGGYFVRKIKNIHSGEVLYETNDVGEKIGGKYDEGDNPIQKDLKNYYWDIPSNRNKIPKFEITMYKNILFQTDSNTPVNVRSYDAIAKMELYYRPLTTEPLEDGTESRKPYPLEKKQTIVETIDPVVGVAEIVTSEIKPGSGAETTNTIAGNNTFQKSSAVQPIVTKQIITSGINNGGDCTAQVPENQKSVEAYTATKTETIQIPAVDFDKGTTDNQPTTLVNTNTVIGTDEEGNPITTVTRVEKTSIVQIVETKKIKEGTLTEKTTTYVNDNGNKSCTITATKYEGFKLEETIKKTKEIGILEVTRETRTTNLTPQPSKMVSYEMIHVGP